MSNFAVRPKLSVPSTHLDTHSNFKKLDCEKNLNLDGISHAKQALSFHLPTPHFTEDEKCQEIDELLTNKAVHDSPVYHRKIRDEEAKCFENSDETLFYFGNPSKNLNFCEEDFNIKGKKHDKDEDLKDIRHRVLSKKLSLIPGPRENKLKQK